MMGFFKKSILCLFATMVWTPFTVSAVFDARYDSKADLKGHFESSSADKMTRGLTNVLLGWTEIAQTPARMSAGIEHGAVSSFLIGLPYGIFRFAGRTLVGVYEVATFYAPQSPIMPTLQGDVS